MASFDLRLYIGNYIVYACLHTSCTYVRDGGSNFTLDRQKYKLHVKHLNICISLANLGAYMKSEFKSGANLQLL